MGSNALAAKAAIRDIIAAIPAKTAEDWQLTWSYTKNLERTWVYVGKIVWDTSDWVSNRSREERFNVEVSVNLKRRRMTPEETEVEAGRIGALIEDAIKADPGLGIGLPLIVNSSVIPKRLDSWPADEMCEAQLDIDVQVIGRL